MNFDNAAWVDNNSIHSASNANSSRRSKIVDNVNDRIDVINAINAI